MQNQKFLNNYIFCFFFFFGSCACPSYCPEAFVSCFLVSVYTPWLSTQQRESWNCIKYLMGLQYNNKFQICTKTFFMVMIQKSLQDLVACYYEHHL